MEYSKEGERMLTSESLAVPGILIQKKIKLRSPINRYAVVENSPCVGCGDCVDNPNAATECEDLINWVRKQEQATL